MADETENQEQEEQAVEETVSAPEGPVAPAPAAEPPVANAEPAPDVEAAAAEAEAPPAEPERKKKRKRLPRAQRRQRTQTKRERPAERRAIARLPKPEHPRGRRQERRGVVVSSAMDKTIVVKVDTVKAHPRYKKVVRRSTKFHAHDERNEAKVGDVVRIIETRPLAKTKNWRLAEVVEVAK
jgi:small subunit ribosomal protein S17